MCFILLTPVTWSAYLCIKIALCSKKSVRRYAFTTLFPGLWERIVSATSSGASLQSANHVRKLLRKPCGRAIIPRRCIIRDIVASLITPFLISGKRYPSFSKGRASLIISLTWSDRAIRKSLTLSTCPFLFCQGTVQIWSSIWFTWIWRSAKQRTPVKMRRRKAKFVTVFSLMLCRNPVPHSNAERVYLWACTGSCLIVLLPWQQHLDCV